MSTHVGSPSTAAVSEIGRGASGAGFFFGMENELVAWMGAYFNLVFGRPQPFPNWSRKLISEVPVD